MVKHQVNSDEQQVPMASTPRVRRTPEEARALILATAGTRLEAHGIRGLNIKDVASDCHINHGTLLHHFGSAEGMRNALLVQLSEELIIDMAAILNSAAPPERLFGELFRLMSQSGQTKLLAWRALEEGAENTLLDAGPSDKLIQQIVEGVARRLQGQDVELARNLIFLALSAAVGWGICGPTLRRSLGMSDAQQDRFPAWVGEQLPKLIQD